MEVDEIGVDEVGSRRSGMIPFRTRYLSSGPARKIPGTWSYCEYVSFPYQQAKVEVKKKKKKQERKKEWKRPKVDIGPPRSKLFAKANQMAFAL